MLFTKSLGPFHVDLREEFLSGFSSRNCYVYLEWLFRLYVMNSELCEGSCFLLCWGLENSEPNWWPVSHQVCWIPRCVCVLVLNSFATHVFFLLQFSYFTCSCTLWNDVGFFLSHFKSFVGPRWGSKEIKTLTGLRDSVSDFLSTSVFSSNQTANTAFW